MKLETFFEKFDLFADAPDAVAKMRELVLELAVRGKLVPQSADDEPASELLTRLNSAFNSDSGKASRQVLTPVDDAYLELPSGWVWTRLGTTGRIFNGNSVSESGKTELSKVADGLPFIATKDVGYGRDKLAYDNGLIVPMDDPRFKVAHADAVLICSEGGSAGRKIGITDRDVCFGNKLYANEVREGIHHRYIFYLYQAPTFYNEFRSRMTGIIGGISRSAFLGIPFPLPPQEEQKRIVAKVDELMGMLDELEAQQQERETRHATLARASLARFADAPTPANLNFIFHSSFSIHPSDLRKSILTLAVQGKLVPPACRQAGKTPTTLPAPEPGAWWVYVIECEDGSFYKGFAENLPRRWKQHLAGTASKWTRKHPPKQVFYWEKCYSKEAATNREDYLKSGSGREWFKHKVVDDEEARGKGGSVL